MSLRVDEIEAAVAVRIAAADATPFDQAVNSSRTAIAFIESPHPLVPQGSARALSHLQFWVLANGAPVIGDRQTPGTEAKTISPLTVSFLYRLRPGKPLIDQRLASRAASVIVRAVKALPQAEWDAQILDPWQPFISTDGEWLQNDMLFSLRYDQPV